MADTRTLGVPVTVERRFGTTEIDAVPERIVAVDVQWTDVLLAMGVDSVGYPVDSFLPQSGVPWQEVPAAAEALPAEDGLPIEKIAALDQLPGTVAILDYPSPLSIPCALG